MKKLSTFAFLFAFVFATLCQAHERFLLAIKNGDCAEALAILQSGAVSNLSSDALQMVSHYCPQSEALRLEIWTRLNAQNDEESSSTTTTQVDERPRHAAFDLQIQVLLRNMNARERKLALMAAGLQ